MAGISGSSSSGSFSLHRKRSVEPRMYSFGCCRSCANSDYDRVSHTALNDSISYTAVNDSFSHTALKTTDNLSTLHTHSS